jgi:hypothetical protein
MAARLAADDPLLRLPPAVEAAAAAGDPRGGVSPRRAAQRLSPAPLRFERVPGGVRRWLRSQGTARRRYRHRIRHSRACRGARRGGRRHRGRHQPRGGLGGGAQRRAQRPRRPGQGGLRQFAFGAVAAGPLRRDPVEPALFSRRAARHRRPRLACRDEFPSSCAAVRGGARAADAGWAVLSGAVLGGRSRATRRTLCEGAARRAMRRRALPLHRKADHFRIAAEAAIRPAPARQPAG